jgi:two-component system, OmpR family, KDP operon response regulator KdpE
VTAILLSDPDTDNRRLTAAALRFSGYVVETATTSKQTRSVLKRRRLAAVIFDPSGDDAHVAPTAAVSAVRAVTDLPLLVVYPSADEGDKVSMLDAGADDYLAKPYGIEELLARLRAALRRRPSPEPSVDPPLTTADFTVDVADRRWVRSDGTEARLTPTEWRLVEMLVRRPGRLVTQAELLVGVWGSYAVDKTEYVRVFLTGIRHKLEPDPARPRYFITVPGVGIRFQSDAGRVGQRC